MARVSRLVRGIARTGTVGLLCVLAVAPVAWGLLENATKKAAPLTQQQKVLHALNRFTFGPRPGNGAAVSRMGLETWFDQQLHPETVDDSAFERRMDAYPALRLPQDTLLARFPSPAMLKVVQRGDLGLPNESVERAIYADAMLEYVKKKEENDGPKTDDVATATSNVDSEALMVLSPEQRLTKLVALTPQQMSALRAELRPAEKLRLINGLSPEQTEIVASLITTPIRLVSAEVLESRLQRDIFSERQLQAVMADFWLNHFNVYVKKNQNEPYLLPAFERDAILPNALGRFEDLLDAVAKSPAMLMYLDNWESIGPNSVAATRNRKVQALRLNGDVAKTRLQGLNENYARELMELHTLGVNGGYTQEDVIAVAKCFTGWTIERPYQGGEYSFNRNRHELGEKIVLGHRIEESGESEGLQVLHILATNPATAHFISEKLAERFVSDTPPKPLVDRMTATFLKSDGDISATLTTMFLSPEFWSPQVYRAKVKTPIEFLVSAVRASDATVTTMLPLVQAMDRLGMPVYGMQTPNGYPWKANDWVSSNALLSRMNFALALSGDHVVGTRVDWSQFEDDGGDGKAATEQTLELKLLGQSAAPRTRATVLAEFESLTMQQSAEKRVSNMPASQDENEPDHPMGASGLMRTKPGRAAQAISRPSNPFNTIAGLLLGSPDFQRR